MDSDAPSSHHIDKAVAGPALHQVGDVDKNRPGDDRHAEELARAAPHLHILGQEVSPEAPEPAERL